MKKIPPIIIASLVLASCQDNELPSNDTAPPQVEESCYSIPDTSIVSTFEVENVAKNIFGSSSISRGITNIETIYDSDGEPSIYVVNQGQNEGFCLVSARKEAFPILAYNKEGHFDVSAITSGDYGYLSEWTKEKSYYVTHAAEIAPDSVKINRKRWRRFENHKFKLPEIQSRSLPRDELIRLQGVIMDSVANWRARETGEMRVYGFEQLRTEHPEEAEYLAEILQGGAMYHFYWDDYDKLTVIVERNTSTVTGGKGDCIKTKWQQGWPYNQSFPLLANGEKAYVGCGVLALAETMRYFKHPTYFNWDNMPYESATSTICDFLYDVAITSKAKFYEAGTGTNMKNVKNALEDYRYNCTLCSYDESKITTPALMSCDLNRNGNVSGHMVIISDCATVTESFRWDVWTFKNKDEFYPMWWGEEYLGGATLWHIHWGYTENCNGYYYDINGAVSKDPEQGTIQKAKQLITNIRPIK